MTGQHQRWRRRLTCFWVCLAAGAGACSNDKPTSSGDSGARDQHPADDDGAPPDQSGTGDVAPLTCALPDGGFSGPACNDLVAAGPCVGQIQVDDNAPAPRGGGLAAGTFDLTERILYTNPGGATGPIGEPVVETLALRGAGSTWTLDRAGFSSTTATRTSASASTSGFTIRLLPTCPDVDGGPPADAGGDGGPPADAGGDGGPPADAGSDGGPPADAGSDGGPPAVPGELIYYSSLDSGATLVLYRLSSAGPVRADTYVRR